ncbi:hypothetical protein Tco_0653709 [Tanacetum coccineum]|uniref:Reverse transcriptase domain-containing protein n=1 Tax=Tanacetum coccineum TaxID=301880 RepID=A0ABQ4X1M2_9ASTR
MSAHYSKTTFASGEQVKVFGNDTGYTIQSVQHKPGLGHPNTVEFTYSDESDEDEPLEIDKSEIDQLVRESSDAFLMGDEELKLYSYEDHFHEELKSIHPLSVHSTPSSDPIVASPSPSLTPFWDSDSLLEETDAFLALDSIPPDIDNRIYDSEGDILFLEKLIKDKPSEAKKSEIDPLMREPSDTFLIGDKEIKFNPLKDIDEPVPIPKISKKPLDSLDSIS